MNLFELFVKIGVDDQASGQLKKITASIGNGLKTAAKVGLGAITTVSAGIAGLTKLSIDQYKEYEQLVGGAQLMFGDAYDYVADKAKNAFSTVQMSQNEYLQQVNGFATGLKTALNGNEQAAAELADRIIKAEADVIAATGNTAENVQNAFNGIMKNNFTLLDNLQLGITPTKEGFQEVIDKVNEWNASMGNATNYQMGNLADMQSALVDYIEMQGLAGYAAKEAAGTISGSWSMVLGAWQNLLTGFANEEADLGELLNNVVDSAITFGKNLIPRISQVLTSISSLFQEALPVVLSTFPTIVSSYFENAPEMLQMGYNVVKSIGKFIIDKLPNLLESTIQIVTTIANGIADNIDTAIPQIVAFIMGLVELLTRPDILSPLIQAALAILVGLVDGIYLAMTDPQWMETGTKIILNIFDLLMENLPLITDAGFKIIIALVSAIVGAWATYFTEMPNASKIFAEWLTSSENAKPVFEAGKSIIHNLWEGLKQAAEWLYGKLEEIVSNIAEKFNIDNIAEKLGLGDLSGVLGTGNIEFNASGIGKVGANAINTLNDGISTVANKVGLGEVNLVLPDGTKFAEYLLPDLEGVSKARGTPIVQPK